ncbi:MAG: condensation domain-containing protein, partial [Acidobacteria bacterium]|nr:condensation domain-containing protein [Acidobacteriota bacterium]
TIPQLNLPLDFPRPDIHNTQSDSVIFEINPGQTTELKKITAETGATSYMILLAVYAILISRYADQDDIIIGTGIAGRRHIDLQNLVGMFVNMLAFRFNISEEISFNEFLNLVRQHAVDAFDNQDFQFDELVKQLGIETHPNRNPLFDTQFTFLSAGPKDDTLEIPGLTLTPYPFSHNKQPFDLDLNAAESDNGILLSLNYQVALFKKNTIENMAGHFMEILSQCLENRETSLKDINLSVKLVSVSTELNHEEVSGFEF